MACRNGISLPIIEMKLLLAATVMFVRRFVFFLRA